MESSSADYIIHKGIITKVLCDYEVWMLTLKTKQLHRNYKCAFDLINKCVCV